jgi:pilus assembly protein CpaF
MEGEVVTMQEIFRFKQDHIDTEGRVIGRFEPTGVRPHFYETFLANGLEAPELFATGAPGGRT